VRRLLTVGVLATGLVFLGGAAPAFAQDEGYPPTTPTSAPPRPPERALAFTGSDTLTLVLIGLAILATGIVLVVAARRRAAARAALR
jgi:LPXTG-motif cell wall-anchored protein